MPFDRIFKESSEEDEEIYDDRTAKKLAMEEAMTKNSKTFREQCL